MLSKWLHSSTKRIQTWFLLPMGIVLLNVGCIQPKHTQTASSPSRITIVASTQLDSMSPKANIQPEFTSGVISGIVVIPSQPTTACANGQPWQYHPNNVKYPWQCSLMNPCAIRCTDNVGAPAGQKCVQVGNKDDGTPIVNIVAPFHTWSDLVAQQDKNGYKCSWSTRYYPGEWPLDDPRNLIVVTPVASPEVEVLRTELLPLR